MSFKTKEEMFGDGGGFGPAVPFSVTNPPGTSAGNRGIQFAEQLTAAIANRTHYALALNDEDLNGRLAIFEVDGLDGAYDNGTVGPAGGGRVITKDAGAVETRSTLGTQYADDPANAHFRADASADVIDGGGGFDFIGSSHSTLAAQAYGYMDRRLTVFAGPGGTIMSGVVASTLNAAGVDAASVTLGAGQFKDGSNNTDLLVRKDLIEITGGTFAGLYFINSISSTTRAVLRRLDGTVPVFPANTAVNIRLTRPAFATFSPNSGYVGTQRGTTITGMPGAVAALELIAGGLHGAYDTPTGGAQYAFLNRTRLANGTLVDLSGLDGLGQFLSFTSNLLIPAANKAAGANFGQAAFLTSHDGSSDYETGFLAKQIGSQPAHYGVVVSEESQGPTFPGGTINFNFIAPAGRIDSADVQATDYFVNPDSTFIEIITPAPQAGIYRVSFRDVNNGEMDLIDLGGTAVVGFPVVGAGTYRILHGVTLGDRQINLEFSSIGAAATRAAAVFEAPAQNDSTCLLLVASMLNNHYAFRLMGIEDGASSELAALTAGGVYYGTNYAYRPVGPTRYNNIGLSGFTLDPTGGGTGTFILGFPGSPERWQLTSDNVPLYIDLNPYLRDGMILTRVEVIVDPGVARAGVNVMSVSLVYEAHNWAVAAPNPINPVLVAQGFDDTTTNKQFMVINPLAHTVIRDSALASRDYWLIINAGTDGGPHNTDFVYGVRIWYTDPGPRNH